MFYVMRYRSQKNRNESNGKLSSVLLLCNEIPICNIQQKLIITPFIFIINQNRKRYTCYGNVEDRRAFQARLLQESKFRKEEREQRQVALVFLFM